MYHWLLFIPNNYSRLSPLHAIRRVQTATLSALTLGSQTVLVGDQPQLILNPPLSLRIFPKIYAF